MDKVKRKVMLDLFASPWSLLPMVGGATALMASWAFGGHPALTFGGIGAMLMGAGIFASRLIFGLERITDRAYKYVVESQQAARLAALEQLAQKLRGDRDPRTGALLSQLRSLYDTLKADLDSGKINFAARDVLERVESIYRICVEYLDRSFQLWQTSVRLKGPARNSVMQQREELINEVAHSVEYLENTVNQLHVGATRKNKSELAQLRAELDETLRVARLAEQRAEAIGRNTQYDAAEFE